MRGESVKSRLVYLYGCDRIKVSNSGLADLLNLGRADDHRAIVDLRKAVARK